MELKAIRRQVYKEPYTTFKFINVLHSSVFKNRNAKNICSNKSAVILFIKEDNILKNLDELWRNTPWEKKFRKNVYFHKQKQKPTFKEAAFISNIILERVQNKTFDEVYIGFESCKNHEREFVLLEIFPVNKTLSFLIPKYLESIIFGILLEAFRS